MLGSTKSTMLKHSKIPRLKWKHTIVLTIITGEQMVTQMFVNSSVRNIYRVGQKREKHISLQVRGGDEVKNQKKRQSN